MNYYAFHIADFALHTGHLSLEEEGVYRRVLDYYYDTEQPIPVETDSVIRRVRLGSYKETLALILEEFFVLQEDGWHNLRADQEIKTYNEKAERARQNGKNGGRPKKNKSLKNKNPEVTKSVIPRNPEKSESKANQEPRTNNQKSGGFRPPSIEEVKSYCSERGNGVNPDTFVDFYSGKGWMVGKNKMRDWKAAVRTWEQREPKSDQSGGLEL